MHVGAIGHTTGAQALKDQLFKTADANGDAALSLDEFKALLDAATNPAAKKKAADAPTLEDIFAQLDANSDGSVTADELGKGMGGLRTRFHHEAAGLADGSAAGTDGDDDATGIKSMGNVQRQRHAHWLQNALGSQLNVNQQMSIAA
jgi:hypothetical protein